ncbi:MAG: helix-turn-helix transcriptional regulator [Deltaproteobacteria bacterium]|nr:helix-turn-helix transcriptional regulator [Deltaproteobacteria bacterium]MBW2360739.1 helix-turn-helix transcriptional regulator [Deltaproteobacteria bacterium]
MSNEVPAVVVAKRNGDVVAQNAPARLLMGAGTGKSCWDMFGGLENAVGLPCQRNCVGGLLNSGMERSQHTRPTIAGQRHHLTCIPVDDVVVCTLGRGTGGRPEKWQSLTAREREVLQLLAEGETTPGAATLLGVSESTLRTHVEKMRNKLGVSTRAALVAEGFRLGYLG